MVLWPNDQFLWDLGHLFSLWHFMPCCFGFSIFPQAEVLAVNADEWKNFDVYIFKFTTALVNQSPVTG